MPRKKKSKSSQKKSNISQKTLRIGKVFSHQRGFGFVRLENSSSLEKDVFIPKKYMAGALDQDIVEVEIFPETNPKGPEGKIVKIVKRTNTKIPAVVILREEDCDKIYIPSFGVEPLISLQKTENIEIGDRILVSLVPEKSGFRAVFCEKIGAIKDANSDHIFACFSHNIRQTFSEECLLEAKSFGKFVRKKDQENRKDLTKLDAMTIDPETAKDFDDALSITMDEKNHFHLGVHIADAAHYVKPDTALDEEAKKRANSTYFPGVCVPMLPETLSNGLCSLKPNVRRLSVSVLMEFDDKGNLLKKEIHRSVIQSKKRWSYDEALSCLEGKTKSKWKKDLQNLVKLALFLKKQRKERGSIDFSLSDTRIAVEENGEPTGLIKEEYDITHQLVEEFMLKANEVVATTLLEKNTSLIYRIHEPPTKENLQEFISHAKTLGFSLAEDPTSEDLQELFTLAKQSSHFDQLCFRFIRAMRLAYYSENNIGHYGLRLANYTHFTSPIRRYADLTVQRILFEENGGSDLSEIASHISDQERRSMKAENGVIYFKKLRLLQREKEQQPQKKYAATITCVKPYMIFFELEDFLLEGSLHIAQIGHDYFLFDEKEKELVGEKTGFSYAFGQKLFVKVVQVDLLLQQIKFALSSNKRKKK